MSYASEMIREVLAAGPNEGEDFYRMKVSGPLPPHGGTAWFNASPAQAAAVAAVMEEDDAADAMATALAEWISDRYGETGAFLDEDETDTEWKTPARLLVSLIDAGASCGDAAHNAYLVPACRRALS